MPLFEQTFAKPGRVHLGEGVFANITEEFIRTRVNNTAKLLKDGNGAPVLLEHADAKTNEGLPRNKRQILADRIANGVGWLVDVKMKPTGEAVHVLDIKNEEIAKKLRTGEIKFTSPEYRSTPWSDGDGHTYQNYISHVALTHHPRVKAQSEIKELTLDGIPALQFSLADYVEPLQMSEQTAAEKQTILRALLKEITYIPDGIEISEADFDLDNLIKVLTGLSEVRKKAEAARQAAEVAAPSIAMSADDEGDEEGKKKPAMKEGGEEKPKDPPANPDLPDADAGKEEQQLQALVTILAELGMALPADTTAETIVRDLLTAAKTLKAAKAIEKPAEQDDNLSPVEGRGPQQFSVADATSDKFTNKLLAKFIMQAHGGIKAKGDALVSAGKITPHVRDSILTPAQLQFSTEGDLVPSFTADQVFDLLGGLPTGLHLDMQLSNAPAGEHPQAGTFMKAPEAQQQQQTAGVMPEPMWGMTAEEAKRLNDQMDGKAAA